MKQLILGILFVALVVLSELPFSISADCSNLTTKEECCNVNDTTIDHNCTFVLCEDDQNPTCFLEGNITCTNYTDQCADIVSTTQQGPIDPTASTAAVSTDTSPSDTPTTHSQDKTTTQSQYQSTAADGGHDEPQGQRFDAASFIGGIVLCGGLVAIIFFSIKFYRSRSDNRYHQF